MHYAAQKAAGYRQYHMAPVGSLYYLGTDMKAKRQRVADKLNCAKQFQPGNIVKFSYGSIRHVIEQRGQYVKVQPIGSTTTQWSNASIWSFVAVDSREYEFQKQIKQLEYERDMAKANAESVARQQQIELSKNTVTRALVHAHSNGYCHETAVALISAGHKLPDVELSLDVTVRLHVTLEGNKSYYLLRELFGATQGDLSQVQEMNYSSLGYDARDKVESLVFDSISTADHLLTATINSATPEWKAPVLRQLDNSEATSEYEMSNSND